LEEVEPAVSGPKRPHDRVPLSKLKEDWTSSLTAKVGFKGFGLTPEKAKQTVKFTIDDNPQEFKNGSVVLAAITSCTNTSNPDVMIAAGLVAKKAIEKGMKIKPFIKTTLSPGSGVVTEYLNKAGLTKYLDELGFTTAGYGCMTSIGNSGELPKEVNDALIANPDTVVAAVLSGNRNFEARIHPLIKANYLASPPLVVVSALSGTVDIDYEKEPIGVDKDGKSVYLRDIWPSRSEVQQVLKNAINP